MARSCHHVGEDAGPLCPLPSAHLSWLECVGWGVWGFIIAALLFVLVSPGDSKRKLGRQAGSTCL